MYPDRTLLRLPPIPGYSLPATTRVVLGSAKGREFVVALDGTP